MIETHLGGIQQLDAVIARGGPLKPVPGGVYRITPGMLTEYRTNIHADHASNLGAILAQRISDRYHVPAFIADPVTTDEFRSVARISGVPGIERKSRSHALNIKYCARQAARSLNMDIRETQFAAAHLGSGFSIAAVSEGRITDVNDALLGMGPFSVERAGSLPLAGILKLAYSEQLAQADIVRRLTRESGFAGYLGTRDLREVEKLRHTDNQAELVYQAMIYQIVKEIGAMFAVLQGQVHGLILTGGLVQSEEFVGNLKNALSFIKRTFVYPGAFEIKALAEYSYRALTGTEPILEYQ